MIISKTQVQNILRVYGRQFENNRTGKTEEAGNTGRKDELAISRESKFQQKLMQAVRQSEDLRPEKVADLQERITAGNYSVSDDEVAEKMLERALVDRLI